MRSVDVALVAVSLDTSKPGNHAGVLLLDIAGELHLPTAPAGDGTVFDAAAGLLKSLTGLTARRDRPGWAQLHQHEVVDYTVRLVERRHQTGGDPWFDPETVVRPTLLVPYSTTFCAAVVDLLDPRAAWVPLHDALGSPLAGDHKTILQGVIARM